MWLAKVSKFWGGEISPRMLNEQLSKSAQECPNAVGQVAPL